jgi:hypothetical protein
VGEFVRPCAGEGLHQSSFNGGGVGRGGASAEIITGIEHGGGLAVSGQCHAGGVAIKMGGGEYVSSVDGGALGFVNRGGVAVVEVFIEFRVDGDAGFCSAIEFYLYQIAGASLSCHHKI